MIDGSYSKFRISVAYLYALSKNVNVMSSRSMIDNPRCYCNFIDFNLCINVPHLTKRLIFKESAVLMT